MASTNQSPEFLAAQKRYSEAQTDEDKVKAMEEMITFAPKHKAGESIRANLRSRYKALKEEIQNKVRQKKSTARKEGIKKEGVQIVLIGLTNSGKSLLLSALTNAVPEISSNLFTTKKPILGSLDYEGIKFQIIDMPAIDFETFDQGVANTADILLVIITSIQDLEKITPSLERSPGKKVIAFSKIDLLSEQEKRKATAQLQSKKLNFILISAKTKENLGELKKKFVENSGIMRIYTKQPGIPLDNHPVIMKPESTIQELIRKIFTSTTKIKDIKITGPSSKFPNQRVGIEHVLKDKDIVEFRTE